MDSSFAWLLATTTVALSCCGLEPEVDDLETSYGEYLQVCLEEWPESPNVVDVLKQKATAAFHEAESQMWTSILNDGVSRTLMERYLSCSGETYHLSTQEMADVFVHYDLSNVYVGGRPLNTVIAPDPVSDEECLAWYHMPQNERHVSVRGLPSQAFGATFGSFSSAIEADVKCNPHTGRMSLEGLIAFVDVWDFNESTHRTPVSEARVTFARNFLTGVPFSVMLNPTPFVLKQNDFTKHGQKLTYDGIENDRLASRYSPFGYDAVTLFRLLYDEPEMVQSLCASGNNELTTEDLRPLFDVICLLKS